LKDVTYIIASVADIHNYFSETNGFVNQRNTFLKHGYFDAFKVKQYTNK